MLISFVVHIHNTEVLYCRCYWLYVRIHIHNTEVLYCRCYWLYVRIHIHNTEVLYCQCYSLYDGIRLLVGTAKIPHRDAIILKGKNKKCVSSQTSRIRQSIKYIQNCGKWSHCVPYIHTSQTSAYNTRLGKWVY